MSIGPPSKDGAWFKSAYSTAGGCCVEVMLGQSTVSIRDSKHLDQPTITISNSDWNLFLLEVVGDLPFGVNGSLEIYSPTVDDVIFRSAETFVELAFNAREWAAFVAGVTRNQFDVTPLTVAS